MNAQQLHDSFQDTLQFSSRCLAEETARAAASGMVYREGFVSSRLYALVDTQIEVVAGTTLDTARKYLPFGKVAVLNFANPHYPGGGPNCSSMTQEECLCRSSNLYPCLSDARVQAEFYQYHRENTDYFFSDRLIYNRGVTVFKDDSPVPVLMPREAWFPVDVITCAAPYIGKRKHTNRAVLEETFKSRIRNVFETAMDNEADVLILGAFGCGAFRNPPEVVARAFRLVLQEVRYRGAFRKVVFAIREAARGSRESDNLAVFVREFSGAVQSVPVPAADVALPGGRILKAGPESEKYLDWKQNNPYFGKQFSVMGDSISTLEGFNPRGYSVFYQESNSGKTGVREMKDTWWRKVIDFFGGELLVNNAWSGSKVSGVLQKNDTFPSGCSKRRTGGLHMGPVKPDVIMVYMGFNDWANGVPVACGEDCSITQYLGSFQGAYWEMLNSLRRNYPDAELWCCTLSESYMRENPAFVFPAAFGGIDIRAYNEMIRETALEHGCKVLDLNSWELPYDSVDGSHPNARGMDTLAVLAIRAVAGQAGSEFLNCEAGRHDNMELQAADGSFRYVCKRCGHIYQKTGAGQVKTPVITPSTVHALHLRRKATGEVLHFTGEQIFAGRSMDCDLRLTCEYTARYQAVFLYRDGNWYVRDNDSRNGTYLNGNRLAPETEAVLKENDVISFARADEVVFLPNG